VRPDAHQAKPVLRTVPSCRETQDASEEAKKAWAQTWAQKEAWAEAEGIVMVGQA